MAVLGVLIASAIPLWLVWSAVCLFNNVQQAKSTGLQVVVSPISSQNPLWLVFQDAIIPVLKKLPFIDAASMVKLSKRGWNFFDRYQMHLKYGKVFAHATPSGIEIFVADAASSNDLLNRRKDFPKPMDMVRKLKIPPEEEPSAKSLTKLPEIINLFGPSVASTDGADWSRHRRITATPFNERNNRIVWSESVRQTAQMLAYFKDRVGPAGSTALGDDAMTLTLHILTSAGLGFSYDFRGSQETSKDQTPDDTTLSYRDCLAAVLDSFLLMALLPKRIWSLPWLPRKLQDFVTQKAQLKRYMEQMVEQTRYDGSPDQHNTSNLLSILVQKNEEARQQKTTTSAEGDGAASSSKKGLSDPELYGNIFIYSFAGHETTAHALAYAMYFLAAYPAVQDWVAAEAARVFADHSSIDDLLPRYDALWPRLKRCLAVMHETLRLYPPVLNIPKTTGPRAQQLRVDAGELGKTTVATLPPGAIVFPNVVALQSHPDYWGADSLEWKPARWIEPAASSSPDAEAEEESLRAPPVKGSFIPWGDGPRVCPGRKFSQVEFVAVVASMLWKHRIEVVPEEGEGFAEAKARILDVMEDAAEGVTLFMKNPERVTVRVVER